MILTLDFPNSLVIQLQPKLHLARTAESGRNLPEVGIAYDCIGTGKPWVIENVEGFSAKFQVHAFTHAGHGNSLKRDMSTFLEPGWRTLPMVRGDDPKVKLSGWDSASGLAKKLLESFRLVKFSGDPEARARRPVKAKYQTNPEENREVTKTQTMASANVAPLTEFSRIAAIDIFRGITVLVMVFVDNLGMVKGLPWWTYHMPREANGMTYVDMVFPAFLFLAGMSIPLAIKRRLSGGDSLARTSVHVLIRSFSLILLGLFIANAPQVDPTGTHMSAVTWALSGFAAIGLGWNAYPKQSGEPLFRSIASQDHESRPRVGVPPSCRDKLQKRENLFRILKLAGIILLLALFALFRRSTLDGHTAWLDFSDWEILGLIGWAYLLVSAIYLLLGNKIWPLATGLAVLVTINAFSTLGWLQSLHQLPVLLQPFEAGLSAIVLSGVIAAQIFFGDTIASTWRKKVFWAFGYAGCLLAAAWALMPLGISKLRDTPAWCLYCAAANTLIFLFLHWIADMRHKIGWSAPFKKTAGENALLPYMLAYVAYFTPQLGTLTADGSVGWPGVVKSILFTALVLAVSFFLTRLGLRLRL